MSFKPLRLSELKLAGDETPAPERGRQSSRGSKIPCAVPSISQCTSKRSLSSEPKSATKIRTTMLRAPSENNLARNKTLCQTPMVTPTRSTAGSTSKKLRTPVSQKMFRKNLAKPTMDQKWILNETSALYSYLVENSLEECIPKGHLKTMSVKQFVSILQHFTELIQNKVKITAANYVEEIPKMMKGLEYNGQLTRSVLIAPNTMHSWPHALALMSWFRVIVECQQDPVSYSRDPDENKQTCVINESIFKMYRLWNQEKEEDVKLVHEECINKYFCDDYCNEDDNQILARKKENIAKLEAKVHQAKVEYEEIEKKLMAFELEMKTYQELEEKRQSMSDEFEKYKQKIEATLSSNAELQAEYVQLQADVKSQKISAEDKINIENEIAHMNRQIDCDRKMCLKLSEANFELDLKIKQENNTVDEIILEHNCFLLKLAECLAALKLDFNINDLKLDAESAKDCSNDLTQKLEKLLKNSKISQEEHLKNTRLLQQRRDDMQKQICEFQNSTKIIEEEITKLQESGHYMIQQYDSKITELESRINELQEEIKSASKYEDMKMDALNKVREVRMRHEKVLEECKSFAESQAELFVKKIKIDGEQLVSVHEAIVKVNNEFEPFLELLERFAKK